MTERHSRLQDDKSPPGIPLYFGELQWQEGVALIRERLRPNLRSHA